MKKNCAGFSLVEIMVAVALVAILAAVAIPSYNSGVIKSKRALGKGELMRVVARQEQYFVDNKGYATDLTALGYSGNPYYIDENNDATVAASSIYQIAFASGASASAFIIQAIPQNSQTSDAECGTLQLSSTGTKSITGGSASAGYCW